MIKTIARYQIIKSLGIQGNVEALLAQDPDLSIDVVVNTLTAVNGTNQQNIPEKITADHKKQFLEYAKWLRSISTNSHIIDLFEVGLTEKEQPYFITPYSNHSLARVMNNVDNDSILSAEKSSQTERCLIIKSIVEQITSALCLIHAKGKTHGAIQPNNIFIDENQKAYLSNVFFSIDSNNQYPQNDIYSLSALAYKLFTGCSPTKPIIPISQYIPVIPEHINQLIIDGLTADESKMQISPKAFLTRLNNEDSGHTPSVESIKSSDDNIVKIKQEVERVLAIYGEVDHKNLVRIQEQSSLFALSSFNIEECINECVLNLSENDEHFVAFQQWVNYVNSVIANHHGVMTSQEQHYLLSIGEKSTNKPYHQLKGILANKQQLAPVKKNVYRPLLMTSSLILFAILLWFYVSNDAQNQEQQQWHKAEKLDSVQSYQSYLTKWPKGLYSATALDRIKQQEKIALSQQEAKQAQQRLIETIQQQLSRLGYKLAITGVDNKQTTQAIAEFEKRIGANITGKISHQLKEQLYQTLALNEEKQWELASKTNTINSYKHYLANSVLLSFKDNAHKRITQLSSTLNAKSAQQAYQKASMLFNDKQMLRQQLSASLVYIPRSTFTMGCIESNNCVKRELPAHSVTVNSFYIMSTEVTYAEWDLCVRDGGCQWSPPDNGWGKNQKPVTNVSYEDITQQYIPWLSSVAGVEFLLPSEAQWAFAAKGKTSTRFATGDTILCQQARFAQFSGECGNERQPTKVKSFNANYFGLFDMYGNVAEWTNDCWHPHYLNAPNNGAAWTEPNCKNYTVRGGSWQDERSFLRASNRRGNDKSGRYNTTGFRLIHY